MSDIVYEFMSTLDQSNSYLMIPSGIPGVVTGMGRDNHFAFAVGSSKIGFTLRNTSFITK